MEEKKWIKIRAIVEVIGKPLEHVQKTILLLGDKFGENVPEIKVTKRSVRPPIKLKDSELYSAFIEFEADVKNLSTIIGIIFDYMPSSVEIIEPEELVETSANINGLLNDLAGRLHQYDDVTKKLRAQNELQRRLLLKAKAKLDKLAEPKEQEKPP